MIIKIFNQSKPINLVITSFMIVFGFLAAFLHSDFTWGVDKIIGLMVAIFSLLTVDFICKKNKLSQQNSYPILFFALLFLVFLITVKDVSIIYANFFILLALRKIISLKSNKNIIKKIFDAGFWIAVATLFSFWSILFYIILFVSITLYASENYKHYLVPFVSIFSLYVIVNSYCLYVSHQLFQYKNMLISFDYSNLFNIKNNIVLGFLSVLAMGIITLIIPSTRQLSKKNKSSYLLIGMALIVSIVIFLFNSKMEVLLFTYFPIAVLLSVIVENTGKH